MDLPENLNSSLAVWALRCIFSGETIPMPYTASGAKVSKPHNSDSGSGASPKRTGNVQAKPPFKVAKRKHRRPPAITYIAADPENFQQVVQLLTGEGAGGPRSTAGFTSSQEKPQPLPTLDTSAMLLRGESTGGAFTSSADGLPSLPLCAGVAPGAIPVFPTLDSWNVA